MLARWFNRMHDVDGYYAVNMSFSSHIRNATEINLWLCYPQKRGDKM